MFLKVLFKPKMSPPPKPPFLWGGGRRLPFKEKGILSTFPWQEKTLGTSFGYQNFSTGCPREVSPAAEPERPVRCGLWGIYVHPMLARGPALGSLAPAPTCLYLLSSGYQRRRLQLAPRSDKACPSSPAAARLPLPPPRSRARLSSAEIQGLPKPK